MGCSMAVKKSRVQKGIFILSQMERDPNSKCDLESIMLLTFPQGWQYTGDKWHCLDVPHPFPHFILKFIPTSTLPTFMSQLLWIVWSQLSMVYLPLPQDSDIKGQHLHNFILAYLFIYWTCRTTCEILVLWPGTEGMPPALEELNLNYWTAREIPMPSYYGTENLHTSLSIWG